MGKVNELFRSRKFWAMVTAVVGAAASWGTGELSPTVAIPTAIGAIMVWINAQGKVDAAERASGPDISFNLDE
jgi:hypothetical protein